MAPYVPRHERLAEFIPQQGWSTNARAPAVNGTSNSRTPSTNHDPGMGLRNNSDDLLDDAVNYFSFRHVTHSGQGISPDSAPHALEYACVKALCLAAARRTDGRELARYFIGEDLAKGVKQEVQRNLGSATHTLPELATLPEVIADLEHIPLEVHGVLTISQLVDYFVDPAPATRFAVITSNLGENPVAILSIKHHTLQYPLYIIYTPSSYSDPSSTFVTIASPGLERRLIVSLVQKLSAGKWEGQPGETVGCQAHIWKSRWETAAPGVGTQVPRNGISTPPSTPERTAREQPTSSVPPPPPATGAAAPSSSPAGHKAARGSSNPGAPSPITEEAQARYEAQIEAQERELESLRAEKTRLEGEVHHYWQRACYWHSDTVRRHDAHKEAYDNTVRWYDSKLRASQDELRSARRRLQETEEEVRRLTAKLASPPIYAPPPPGMVYVPMQPVQPTAAPYGYAGSWTPGQAGGHWTWSPHEAYTGEGAPGDTRPPQMRESYAVRKGTPTSRERSKRRLSNSSNEDEKERYGEGRPRSPFMNRQHTPPPVDPGLAGPGPLRYSPVGGATLPSPGHAGYNQPTQEKVSSPHRTPAHRTASSPEGILRSGQGTLRITNPDTPHPNSPQAFPAPAPPQKGTVCAHIQRKVRRLKQVKWCGRPRWVQTIGPDHLEPEKVRNGRVRFSLD